MIVVDTSALMAIVLNEPEADPASLNFGDCFAYELTKANGCRLLCIGDDFRRTDIGTVFS